MPHLVLKNDILSDVAYPLNGGLVLLGRGAEAHVRLDDASVSRLHARITCETGSEGEAWRIEDLDSRHGTFLNDLPLAGPSNLREGDVFRLGALKLEFRAGVAPQGRSVKAAPKAGLIPKEPKPAATAAPKIRPPAPPRRRAVLVTLGCFAALCAGIAAFALQRKSESPLPDFDIRTDPPSMSAPMRRSPPTDRGAMAGAPGEDDPPSMPSEPTPDESTMPMDPSERMPAPQVRPERRAERPTPPEMTRPAVDPPSSPPTMTEPAEIEAAAIPPTPEAEQEPTPVAVPRRAPTEPERFALRRLHFDLLGRPPSADELEIAAAAPRDELIDRLLASPERWESWFEDELYEFLLIDAFRPGEDQTGGLPARLAAGTIGVRDALGEIAKSQQFNARNPGNDTYVTVVLEQMLGVVVQKEPQILAEGKDMYDGRRASLFGKSGRSQSDFVDLALAQPSFATRYLQRRIADLLGRAPDAREVERHAKRLRADPLSYRAIEKELLLSPTWSEGLKRPKKKSDRRFLSGLWHDVVGRAPTYQELRNLRNASQSLTDPAGLRSLVIAAILNSDAAKPPKKEETEASAWISDRFLALLGRSPTQEELAAFVAAWGAPACRPSTVLHALLTGPEYDHY